MSDHRTHRETEHKGTDAPAAPKSTPNGADNLENAEVRNVVSEITSESVGEEGGTGTTQSAAQAASQAQRAAFEQRKKELIASQPPAPKMVHEINVKLHQEVKKLKSEERQYRWSSDFHNLGKVIARLREINEIVGTIAHATYEVLKKIWLKVVHGIV